MGKGVNVCRENVYILCGCGGKHLLKRGVDAPVYWCGDKLMVLKAGDDVEYDDEVVPFDDIADVFAS